ncbi:MAG: hypothetical protein M3Y24_10310 [Acidobacteriota bacterium]|nr:hypothetical protein [Acidobacteriota bacterium]
MGAANIRAKDKEFFLRHFVALAHSRDGAYFAPLATEPRLQIVAQERMPAVSRLVATLADCAAPPNELYFCDMLLGEVDTYWKSLREFGNS